MQRNQKPAYVKTCILMMYLPIAIYVLVFAVEAISGAIAELEMQQVICILRERGFEVEEVPLEHSVVNDAEVILSRDDAYIPYLNYTSTLDDFIKIAERCNVTVVYLNRALREFWFIAPAERYSKEQYLVNLYCFRIEKHFSINDII